MKINGVYTVLVTVMGIILLDMIVQLFNRLPAATLPIKHRTLFKQWQAMPALPNTNTL